MATTTLEAKEYFYPKGYKNVPIEEKIIFFSKTYNLDPQHALDFVRDLPKKPVFGEIYLAVPGVPAVYEKNISHGQRNSTPESRYCSVLRKVQSQISKSRDFSFAHPSKINEYHLKVTDHTKMMFSKIRERQKGDILIISAQMGEKWKNHSVDEVRNSYEENEFGLTLFTTLTELLVNQSRCSSVDELDIDCPGDNFSDKANGDFDEAPRVYCNYRPSYNKSEIMRKNSTVLTAGSWTTNFSHPNFGSATGFIIP